MRGAGCVTSRSTPFNIQWQNNDKIYRVIGSEKLLSLNCASFILPKTQNMMQTNWTTVSKFFISWLVSPRKNSFLGKVEIKQISNDIDNAKIILIKVVAQLKISWDYLILTMIRTGLIRPLTQGFFSKKPDNTETVSPLNAKPPNKSYLPQAIIEGNKDKPKLLPPSNDPSKLTVVMELDQVLAYVFTPDEEGYMMSPRRKEDFHLWFQEYQVLLNIYKRKNLQNFLAYLNQECEPVIFSTGVRSYVELVMSLIDPTRKIKHIITQQHCDKIIEEETKIDQFAKDLQLLGRDMSRVVYMDSKPMAFWLYPQNGLPWQEFRADNQMRTQDLDLLIIELEYCRKRKDCREYLLEQYNLREDFVKNDLLL